MNFAPVFAYCFRFSKRNTSNTDCLHCFAVFSQGATWKKKAHKGKKKKKAATTSTETHSDKDFRYLFSLRFLFMFNFSNFACVLMFRFRQTPTFISIIPFLRGVQKGTSTVCVHMEWIGWMVISLKNSFPFLLHFNNYQSSFRVSFSVSVAGHTFITPTKCNGFFFFLM